RSASLVLEQRVDRSAGEDVPVLDALRMALEDLLQVELVVHAERHEARAPRLDHAIAHREADLLRAVDADRHRLAPRAVALAELLLRLDELGERLVGDRRTAREEARDVGTHLGRARVDQDALVARRGDEAVVRVAASAA